MMIPTVNSSSVNLPRWLVFSWIGVLVLSGSLWLIPNDYSIKNTKLEFLTDAPSAQAGYAYSGMVGGLYLATMPDKNILVLDGGGSYLFNPFTRDFNQLSGVDLKTDTEGDITGTTEGQVSDYDGGGVSRYNNIVIGQDVWQVGGFNIRAISPDGTRNYPLDINFGYLPFVVKLSDTELLIAGVQRGSGITLIDDLEDPKNQSKLFKYNIKTNQLSDTGKLTPTLFGGKVHFTTYYDFGDWVLVWERSGGGVYLLNKRTLKFKKVASNIQRDATSATGAKLQPLTYNMYPINRSMVLLFQGHSTIHDAIYTYNRHSNKLSQLTLSSIANSQILARAQKTSSTGKVSDIVYIPIVSGGRFLSLMPYEGFDRPNFNSQLQSLWERRLVLDLSLKKFVGISDQPIKMKAGLVKNDTVLFYGAWPLSTGWSWLTERSGQVALYWAGVAMAPFSWLTWQQLDYPLSFIFWSLLVGGAMMLYLRRKTMPTIKLGPKR